MGSQKSAEENLIGLKLSKYYESEYSRYTIQTVNLRYDWRDFFEWEIFGQHFAWVIYAKGIMQIFNQKFFKKYPSLNFSPGLGGHAGCLGLAVNMGEYRNWKWAEVAVFHIRFRYPLILKSFFLQYFGLYSQSETTSVTTKTRTKIQRGVLLKKFLIKNDHWCPYVQMAVTIKEFFCSRFQFSGTRQS